jgi:hypothetical protein
VVTHVVAVRAQLRKCFLHDSQLLPSSIISTRKVKMKVLYFLCSNQNAAREDSCQTFFRWTATVTVVLPVRPLPSAVRSTAES